LSEQIREYEHLTDSYLVGLADDTVAPLPTSSEPLATKLTRVQLAHALLELAKLTRSTVPIRNPYYGLYKGELKAGAYDPFGPPEPP
jgi:hypothetical protein